MNVDLVPKERHQAMKAECELSWPSKHSSPMFMFID